MKLQQINNNHTDRQSTTAPVVPESSFVGNAVKYARDVANKSSFHDLEHNAVTKGAESTRLRSLFFLQETGDVIQAPHIDPLNKKTYASRDVRSSRTVFDAVLLPVVLPMVTYSSFPGRFGAGIALGHPQHRPPLSVHILSPSVVPFQSLPPGYSSTLELKRPR